MGCVVFDTSFLLNCVKARVDFLREIKMRIGPFTPVVPSPVIDELKKLAAKKPEARVALKLVGEARVVESHLGADRSVVEIAASKGCYLASTDGEVRSRGRERGIKLVTLREGKHIQM